MSRTRHNLFQLRWRHHARNLAVLPLSTLRQDGGDGRRQCFVLVTCQHTTDAHTHTALRTLSTSKDIINALTTT